MKTMALYVGSLMAILTTIYGWASAAARPADKPVATAPTGQSRTTEPEQFAQLRWDLSQKGREIDLSQYKRTFNDDFKTMDIVKDNSDPGPGAVWFSPGHGASEKRTAESGRALQAGGRRGSPPRREGRQAVAGACLTTVNTRGEGFAQQYGYFEMTAEYNYPPPGPKGSRIWGGVLAQVAVRLLQPRDHDPHRDRH